MNPSSGYAKAKKYVDTHPKYSTKEIERLKRKYPGPCLTISRQGGIDIQPLCENMVKKFGEIYSCDWAYFDKELLEKVINDYKLPLRIQKFLVESKQSAISQMLNELLGIHPPVLELIHKMSKTVYKLAEFGNVIIVGRGANIITSQLKNSYHIRLIAPINYRISELREKKKLTKEAAKKNILEEDKNRKEFMLRNFHREIDDPETYNLVINVSSHSKHELIDIIINSVQYKFPLNLYKNLNYGSREIKSRKGTV